MSSKLFVLAALVLLPLASQAEDTHFRQGCLSTSDAQCKIYNDTLTAHADKPDFDRLRLEMQERMVRNEVMKRSKISLDAMKQKQYENLLIQEGMMADDAAKVAAARYSRLSIGNAELRASTDKLKAGTDKLKGKTQELNASMDSISESADDSFTAAEISRLRIYARSNLKGVSEMDKHKMLQRADRLQRALDQRSSVGSVAGVATSKAVR